MLAKKLHELEYKESSVDMSLYYKVTKPTLVIVGVYVDILLVTSYNARLVDEFFENMKKFDVKDLRIAAIFLEIRSRYETASS
jgi:hypothetical protein